MSEACFECDLPARHDHHVVPRSRGGTRTIPLCERCHGLVHDTSLTGTSHLTKTALAAKKAKGERVGGIPYGWRLGADGVKLERCEEEQAVIAICRQLKAEGWTLSAICTELEQKGFRPRSGKKWFPMQASRNASRWHPVRVFRVLKSAGDSQ